MNNEIKPKTKSNSISKLNKPINVLNDNNTLNVSCLLETIRSDPITSLCVSKSYCIIGCLFGRVGSFLFHKPLSEKIFDYFSDYDNGKQTCYLKKKMLSCWNPHKIITTNKQDSVNCLGISHMLAAYSDDCVRALYTDDKRAYAVIGNSSIRIWDLSNFSNQTNIPLDKRVNSSLKYVLPYRNKVFIASTGLTILLDLYTQTSIPCLFRLVDKDVVPCSFNGTHLAVFTHHPDDIPFIGILKLANINETVNRHNLECVYSHGLTTSQGITVIKLWRCDRFVYTWKGRDIIVVDWVAGQVVFKLVGHKNDIIALDTSNESRLISLSIKPEIKIWDSESGTLIKTITLNKDITFDSGVQSLIESIGRWLFVTSDQGLISIDLSSGFP